MNTEKWYAIYVKPRTEKKVDAALTLKGIKTYCPLQKIQKQWSDRKKIVEEPLFKSYVFVNIKFEQNRDEVLITPNVLNFVKYLRQPAVIRDEDIDTIKRFLLEDEVKIETQSIQSFNINTKIKVRNGVFIDAEGTVVKLSNKTVYVLLESLETVLVVEFKKEHILSI